MNDYQFRNDGKRYTHFRAFKIKFIQATNTKGERVSILDVRHKQNNIISYNYSKSNICEIAIDWLESEHGLKILGFFYNERAKCYYVTTENFEPLKEVL